MKTPTMDDYESLSDRISRLESKQGDMDELISLLRQVQGALLVFVRVGNAFKWLIGLAAAFAAVWYAIKEAFRG